ncbi:WW domain-containing adapter protein with coiled-coil [Plakobranchus ocellatus]|uniref:WW domain-containing adapter protein with coiled-coil n=1 Tax=Plakobranchus ocellatus TaxID=259542 RepID=A0AAV4D0F4_9GAST|nr:WW domain-containing adapter protein with coiled-coil [Plakobranchus ocellatus]
MHARKQPRLNDGYADRKDTHLHQDMQYHSSLFVDGNDDEGPLGSRVSPRYQNKSSYIERNKEKRGSLSLAEKKVSHYLATGSLGRPIPLDSSFPDSSELGGSGGGGYDQQRSSSSSSHHRKDRVERGRDYNSHTYSTSSSSHKADQGREHASHYSERGDHRSQTSSTASSTNNGRQASTSSSKEVSAQQVQKSAIRVCGDWSEHISSSGKRYYYNCKTEVSQWEKPKDWVSELCKTPDHRSKDNRPRQLSQTPHANKITADSRGLRHSSSSEHQQHEHLRHRANSGENTSDSYQGSSRDSMANTHSSQYRERDSRGDGRDMHRNRLSVDSNSNNSNLTHSHQQQHHHRSGSTPGGNNGVPESHPDYQRSYSQYNSHHHHQQYSSSNYKRQGNESGRRRRGDSYGSHRYHDTGQGPIDDMDISPSPSPSPSSSQPSSTAGTPQHVPPTSTPLTSDTATSHYHNSSTPQPQRVASPQGNPIPTLVNRQTAAQAAPEGEAYDKTIQTLKKLQNALSMHIRAQQSTTTSSSRSSMSQPAVRQSHSEMPSVSNSSFGGSMVAQQQQLQQQQQQSLQHQQQQHSAAMLGSTVPGMQPQHQQQHLMYQTGHQQHQQQQGLLPIPHHQVYQQQQQQQQQPQPQMMPNMSTGTLISAVGGTGSMLAQQQQQQQDEAMGGGRTSPVSATSSQSSCGSPTPSDSSSQNAAVAGNSQALSAAAMKREETAKLTASLSNYYNEKLIAHVLGWHADALEKQSSKLWEEWMVNGSLQASQISVQLKRARSQVRIAEIQSTLHEQRIMSSEQQRQEIENLKTPSNFLPS